ncbi:short-chain dehydrogenase [Kutzneria sp. 744]|nr:short-chain dehydrogenase [Kutzneria sp. 744]
MEKLRAAGVDAFSVPLDVTDDGSVAAAVELIGRLDVLVNNAGVDGGLPSDTSTVDLAAVRNAVETNVFGVIRVTNAMLPLLRRSTSPRIVNMSSHAGSVTQQVDSDDEVATSPLTAAYGPSKTFLNAVTVQYAKKLPDFRVNAGCPGYCATDFNGFRGVRAAEQGGGDRHPARDPARRRPHRRLLRRRRPGALVSQPTSSSSSRARTDRAGSSAPKVCHRARARPRCRRAAARFS